MAYFYLIEAACPSCYEHTRFVEKRDGPIPVDQDVVFRKPYCPNCGDEVHDGGEWDVQEESRIERVPPVEELETETVRLPTESVDEVFDDLEDAMKHGERTMSHDEIRPSAGLLARDVKRAYRKLVEAHPGYDFVEGDEVVEE